MNVAAGHLQTDLQSALEAIAKSFAFLDSSGAMHTQDEEESLFPRLRPKRSAGELAFVDSLEDQHREAETIYSELKQLVGQASSFQSAVPAEFVERYRACAARLRSLYRAHIQSEDEILTRLATRFLNDPELAAISGEMRQRRQR